MNILLVDDDPADLELFSTNIRRATKRPCKLVASNNYAQAIESARHKRFDVAIIDYHLYAKKGLMLAQELRKLQQQSPRLPVLIISGDAAIETTIHQSGMGEGTFFAEKSTLANAESMKNHMRTLTRTLPEHITLSGCLTLFGKVDGFFGNMRT
jgi:CheY-like chemotaxis protein